MNLEQDFETTKVFRDLNRQQREAVNYLEGPLLVMAGAGSGKTRVLTCRIANLIAQGISPWNILGITFTNKAADEMKYRAESLIGKPGRVITLNTFHAFCARLLRREIKITGKFSGDFSIYTASDSTALINRCLKELNLNPDSFSNAHAKISYFKSNLVSPEKYREWSSDKSNNSQYSENIKMIYELYQKKLQDNNALDFDDLIFTAVKIFKKYPEVLEKYQERFVYISVDEFQDTNMAQYVLTKLLAGKYKNLCVVGDADQSIYGWRGANINNILNFEKDYPNAKVVFLEENYRSTKIILEAANSVIGKNLNRKPKNLWTKNERGDKIKFISCWNETAEAEFVKEEISTLVKTGKFSYPDIALLYRTNAQSRVFEETFTNSNIPHVIIGGLRFYDRKEVKDIVAYLHVIVNPRDDVHLLRIINTPRRGLGVVNMNRLINSANEQGLPIFDVITNKEFLEQVDGLTPKFRQGAQNFAKMIFEFRKSAKTLSIGELIKDVMHKSGYNKMLSAAKESEEDSRRENLDSLINSANDFIKIVPDATLRDFLNNIALISDLDNMNERDSCVKLMTIHSAKGMEFPVVFVVGMENGLFPHANSFDNKEELEEERRACYVAFTRAKKKLYLTAARERTLFGRIRDQETSPFVEEIYSPLIERLFFNLEGKFVPIFESESRYIPPITYRPAIESESRYIPPITYRPAIESESRYIPPITYRPAIESKSRYIPPTAHRPAQMKPAEKKKSAPPVTWRVGDRLNHKNFGLGTIMEVSGEILTVIFKNPETGIKKIKASIAPINKL